MPATSHNAWVAPFSAAPLSYERAEAMAHDTGFFGNTGDPLLETVVEMLDELGRPDAAFDVVQVAGTNGKTSTSRYTAAILAGQGLACALYTSPELVEMRERMEVAGAPVSREAFAHGIALAATAGERVNARRAAVGERPFRVTEFDLLTVAACVVFAEARVDVAVLEVGLGGRWDATSATHPAATCVTGIGLDHCRILGGTLEKIAAEKAAVIKAGQACVLGVGTWSPSTVEDVLLERAVEQGVVPTLLRPSDPTDAPGEVEPGSVREHPELPHAGYVVTRRPERVGDTLELAVTTPRATYEHLACAKPLYQAANVACATALAEAYLGHALDAGALRASVTACPTPGRFDVLQDAPVHLIDASHNPQSVAALLASLDAIAPDVSTRPALLCAVLADKDVDGIVSLLAPAFPRVYVTATASPRALPAAELAERFSAHGVEASGTYPTVADAAAALADKAFVACGSITLAGGLAGLARLAR